MGNKFSRKRPQIDDRYTRPQGLYQHKDVDHKKLRRLIMESKLAPCYPGGEDAAVDLDECPICFLHYPSLNRSKCCTKGICTECFLQVKSPHSARPTHMCRCPFCKTPGYAVEYRGAKTLEEKGVEQAEEQKVIEAKIRIRRQQEIQDEAARLQRLEQVSEEVVAATTSPARQETDLSTPAFPVFAGPTVVDERTLERMSPAERSWNSWTSVDRPAIGYPQSNFFTFPAVTNDNESMWFQRDADGVARHHQQLSSSSVVATRNSSSFNSRRRAGWSNSSSSDFGPGTGSEPLHPNNREDDFDLDLEEIMLMEAIWLSIQEQGSQRPTENSSESSFPSPFAGGENENLEQHSTTTTHDNDSRIRGTSVTAGFASAIAALAERQVAGSDPPSQQPGHNDSNSNRSGGTSTNSIQEGSGLPDKFTAKTDDQKAHKVNHGAKTNDSDNDDSVEAGNLNRWMRERSSEVGTSCSSTPCLSEVPEVVNNEEADVNNPNPTSAEKPPKKTTAGIPETFEEQMMLAMAISLAEAQGRKNIQASSVMVPLSSETGLPASDDPSSLV